MNSMTCKQTPQQREKRYSRVQCRVFLTVNLLLCLCACFLCVLYVRQSVYVGVLAMALVALSTGCNAAVWLKRVRSNS